MDFLGSKNKGEGTWLVRLPGLSSLSFGWICPQHNLLPSEIQGACKRLGVPLSLFVGLMKHNARRAIFGAGKNSHAHHPMREMGN